MAFAAPSQSSAFRLPTAKPMPDSIFSIGRRTPINPVEQIKVSEEEIPRVSETISALLCVSAKPSGPVQALAPPEFSSTASICPSLITCLLQTTGAAITRFLVKTAAALFSGPTFWIKARSGKPLLFNPAATPVAKKPFGFLLMRVIQLALVLHSRQSHKSNWHFESLVRPHLFLNYQ